MNYPAVDYVSDDTLESFAVDIYGEDVASKHISLVGEFRDANEQYGIMLLSSPTSLLWKRLFRAQW